MVHTARPSIHANRRTAGNTFEFAGSRVLVHIPRVMRAAACAAAPVCAESTVGPKSSDCAAGLMGETLDFDALVQRGLGREALDQFVVDRVLGIA